MLKQLVDILIKNNDFESFEEFEMELKSNRDFMVDEWIRWRAAGGLSKNEKTVPGLADAYGQILKILEGKK